MICIVGGGPRANWGASSLDASACCHHGSISHRLCGRHRPLRQETELQHWDIYWNSIGYIEIQDPMACQDLSSLSSLIYLIFTYHFCSLLECHQSYPSMASSPLQLLARGHNERHGKSRGPSVHMRAPIAIKLVVLEALNWGHGTSHIVIQTALKPSHEPSEHLVKLRWNEVKHQFKHP